MMVGKAVAYCWVQRGDDPSRMDPLIFRDRFGIEYDLHEIFNYSEVVGKMAAFARNRFDDLEVVQLEAVPNLMFYIQHNGLQLS